MSLKQFHLIFIIFSILICLLYGLWALNYPNVNGEAFYTVSAFVSFACSIALGVYAGTFVKNLLSLK